MSIRGVSYGLTALDTGEDTRYDDRDEVGKNGRVLCLKNIGCEFTDTAICDRLVYYSEREKRILIVPVS